MKYFRIYDGIQPTCSNGLSLEGLYSKKELRKMSRSYLKEANRAYMAVRKFQTIIEGDLLL